MEMNSHIEAAGLHSENDQEFPESSRAEGRTFASSSPTSQPDKSATVRAKLLSGGCSSTTRSAGLIHVVT